MMQWRWVVVGLVAVLGAAGWAEVALPHLFSDHMVLQQRIPVPVWGTAGPGEAVTVLFAGQIQQTVADTQGRWRVRLDPLAASGSGRTLTVVGTNTLVFTDVLVGEVWVCSGQSNMQFGLGGSVNGQEEIQQANYPHLRVFTVPNVTATTPQIDCGGTWKVCTPETAAGFTAVGYFFGRHLHQALEVPVGLIHTSWGGTVAEAWTSASALRAKLPEFIPALDALHTPSATQEAAVQAYRAKVAERDVALQKLYDLEDDLEGAKKFAAPDLDDRPWMVMPLPGNWEVRGMKDLDGIVWFRKTLDIPAAWAGKEIILRPGPIDEVDDAWFNGAYIDGKGRMRTQETQYWNVPRAYRVPGHLVKAGPNVVAIRVFDAVGQGGLWGAPAETMYAELADGSDQTHLSLAGDWRARAEYTLPVLPPNPATPNTASLLYNAMIHPLIPYGIKGAIWYQGESNASRHVQYRTLLPAMITDWRARWGQGAFPFLIVQLANFMDRNTVPEDTDWAALREAQALTAATLPKTGLAAAIDIGEAGDIHPKNKQDVGLRLALNARAIAYGQQIEYSGPLYKSMTVKGGQAILTFTHTGGGLVARGEQLTGFAIAGADGKFVWAQARIEGNKVIVRADGIAKPAAVRYAWANNPACNLYNGAGLPAVPFRTDRKR